MPILACGGSGARGAAAVRPGRPTGSASGRASSSNTCACFRPVRRVAAWFSSHGLAVSPGTLANSRKRFAALFGTLYEAILDHQNDAALRPCRRDLLARAGTSRR